MDTAIACTTCVSSAGSSTPVVLMCLLCSLVAVNSQTIYPNLEFRGETVPNHGYVDLSEVGTDLGDSGNTVRCHTDLTTCCRGNQGPHRGDWYFPDGEKLGFSQDSPAPDIYEVRGDKRVDLLHRNNADMPSGIYRCEIQTNDDDISERETVYAGLYSSGGIFTFQLYTCYVL